MGVSWGIILLDEKDRMTSQEFQEVSRVKLLTKHQKGVASRHVISVGPGRENLKAYEAPGERSHSSRQLCRPNLTGAAVYEQCNVDAFKLQ